MSLTKVDYRARMSRLAELAEGGAVLVLSQPTAYRNSTVEHGWRQESFLYYMTGFVEAESALLVLPFKPEGERYHLFLRERDPERELWDGKRLGTARAKSQVPVDQAHTIESLWDKLPDLMGEAKRLYVTLGLSEDYDRRIIRALAVHKGKHGKHNLSAKVPLFDAQYLAGLMRLRKGPEEVERMRDAAAVTRQTFAKVYRTVRPGMTERDVHGLILGEFMAGGAEMEAYGGIVAGGNNACCLHYRDNDQLLKDGDLLLIDAGAQKHYYASDVTRTFPIGRRFSSEQKAVYEIVLAAQKAAIAKATVGSTLPKIHDEATGQLIDGLLSLGILKGSKDEILAKGSHRKYYPHGTSHWIGMDVHDVGMYRDRGDWMKLESGMYFSVEPGLYFDAADESVPAPFRGIGIRIEDDVLVTAQGPDVLTDGIAKEVHELENRN